MAPESTRNHRALPALGTIIRIGRTSTYRVIGKVDASVIVFPDADIAQRVTFSWLELQKALLAGEACIVKRPFPWASDDG